MTANSVLMRPQDLSPGTHAPTCLPLLRHCWLNLSSPLVRVNTSKFQKIRTFIHHKLRTSASEEPFPFVRFGQTPIPLDCACLLWTAAMIYPVQFYITPSLTSNYSWTQTKHDISFYFLFSAAHVTFGPSSRKGRLQVCFRNYKIEMAIGIVILLLLVIIAILIGVFLGKYKITIYSKYN